MRGALPIAWLACLTLGLAPYYPEPHLTGKIRWVLGGAEGMQAMDWFDLVLHGTPWVVMLVLSFATPRTLATQRKEG